MIKDILEIMRSGTDGMVLVLRELTGKCWQNGRRR